MYLYKALQTLVASKDIANPLHEAGLTISTDFPITASSSEGGGTATTIEMAVEESVERMDSSESILNDKMSRRISDSVSITSTAASKYKRLCWICICLKYINLAYKYEFISFIILIIS